MQTWTLTPAATATGNLAEFATGLIHAIGAPSFGARTLALVNEAVPFASWSIYRVGDVPPRMYVSAAHCIPDTTLDCWRAYQAGLHRRDPTFRSRNLSGIERPLLLGHWRAEDIRQPHREQIYERHGMRERVSLAQACANGGVLAVNLYRHDHQGAVRPAELRELQAIGPLLFACAQRHLALIAAGQPPSPAPPSQPDVLLSRCPSLTSRELDVCLRLAQGLTFDGIAADLGISATTVKTYRNRAFARLGIQHRNQLFKLLLDGGATSA
ncbi:MAG: LuxR C-terminal-related transcriptional regulator [Pigmentiphaga sp.]